MQSVNKVQLIKTLEKINRIVGFRLSDFKTIYKAEYNRNNIMQSRLQATIF